MSSVPERSDGRCKLCGAAKSLTVLAGIASDGKRSAALRGDLQRVA